MSTSSVRILPAMHTYNKYDKIQTITQRAMDFPGVSGYVELVKGVPYVLSALMIEFLLFGVHVILFCICAYILTRRHNPAHLIILLSIIIMFALAVADIALSLKFVFHDVPALLTFSLDLDSAINRILTKAYLFVSNNLVADGLLIYRCYKVWDNRKSVLLVAGVILVADSVWGYLSITTAFNSTRAITFTPVFFSSVFGFNIIMTLVTAGRIWWVARLARPILGRQQLQRYHTAIAIIIESGAIYSISVLLVLVIPVSKSYRIIFLLVTIRMVCIMPTLMIVQIELGRSPSPEQPQGSSLSPASSHQLRLSTTPRFSTVSASAGPAKEASNEFLSEIR